MSDLSSPSPLAVRAAAFEPWLISRWSQWSGLARSFVGSVTGRSSAVRGTLIKGTVFAVLSALLMGLMVMPTSNVRAQPSMGDVVDFFTPSNPDDVKQKYEQNLNALKNAASSGDRGVGCWGCKVFDMFSKSVFQAGRDVSSHGAALAGVITAVASLFSLIYIGGAFVSGDASDLLSRWKVFWQLLIAVAIGTAWLTTNGGAFSNTWEFIYGPLMKIPLATADAVSGGVGGSCGAGALAGGAPPGGAEIMKEMRDVVCGGHLITMKGIAFGIALGGSGDGFIGSLLNLCTGIAIVIIFAWVAISFPLRFIDVLIRLTIVGIITPILVVCATFKPTRGYIKIGISNVLFAGASFAVTSIMFKLGSSFFDEAVNARVADVGNWSPDTTIADSVVIVAIGVIFASMLKMAPSIASEFSQFQGNSGSSVGDSASNLASSVATLPVKGAAAVVAAKTGGAAAGKSIAAAGGLGKRMSKTDD